MNRTGSYRDGWSKRGDFWRLRINGHTVALAVPNGLRWRALGFKQCQTAFRRIFDGPQDAMIAAAPPVQTEKAE